MLTRKRLLAIPLTFVLFQSPLLAADKNDVPADSLTNVAISKNEIIESLDMLKKDGRISQDDYDRAKKELTGMSDTQVNGIKEKAVDMMKKDPAKVNELLKEKKH